MEFQKQKVYKFLVIGANGGIGRRFVELALNAGHQVTAVLRNPSKLHLQHQNLNVVRGDILESEAYEKHLASQDAIISAIGNGGDFMSDPPTTLYSQGNANLLQAMKKMNANRVFFISASAIEVSPVLPFYVRIASKYIIQKLLKNMYDDLRRMELSIKESEAQWTIIRPPQLTDKPVTGHYRVAIDAFLPNCLQISRADVAHYMLDNIENEQTYRAIVEIGY